MLISSLAPPPVFLLASVYQPPSVSADSAETYFFAVSHAEAAVRLFVTAALEASTAGEISQPPPVSRRHKQVGEEKKEKKKRRDLVALM